MSTVRKEELTFGHRQCVKPDQVNLLSLFLSQYSDILPIFRYTSSVFKDTLLFGLVFSGCRGFLALATAEQARGAWVYYDACPDPGRAPWRCSERLASLRWLFLYRGCFPPR